MGWSAFQPQSPTAAIAVTTAASTPIQVAGNSGGVNYLVSNATTQACFLAYGSTSAQASAGAVIPVAGTPSSTLYLGPNSTQSFTIGPSTWFSAIAPATTSTVYITSGDGL